MEMTTRTVEEAIQILSDENEGLDAMFDHYEPVIKEAIVHPWFVNLAQEICVDSKDPKTLVFKALMSGILFGIQLQGGRQG